MDKSNPMRKPCMFPRSNSSCILKNNQKWELHKEEIRKIYLEENNTLEITMERIEQSDGFKKSSHKDHHSTPLQC